MFFTKKVNPKEEQRKNKLEEQLKDLDPSTLVGAFNHDIDDIPYSNTEYPEGTIFLDDDIVITPDLDQKAKLK